MIRLYDAERGESLGAITEAQLQVLVDALEEESSTDRDYYINGATIDMLESDGADPGLVTVLRGALRGREEMEIRWSTE